MSQHAYVIESEVAPSDAKAEALAAARAFEARARTVI